MLAQGPLKDSMLISPLRTASVIAPEGHRHKKSIFSDLMLTSLIDAFSILVIYLLIYFGSSSESINIEKGTQLPMAAKINPLEKNTVVKLSNGEYFVNEEKIGNADALVARLVAERQVIAKANNEETIGDATLVVQADKRSKYESISQVITAGSNAGFSDIHFAVIQK